MPKQLLYAITLHRPWGWAIACLNKDVENRNWRCPLPEGALIAIHSGKTWDDTGAQFIASLNTSELISIPPEPEHPVGIIAIATFAGNLTESRSEWFFGAYGWKLSSVVTFDKIIPCRGQQKLWRVPEDVLPSVRSEYRNALARDRRMGA